MKEKRFLMSVAAGRRVGAPGAGDRRCRHVLRLLLLILSVVPAVVWSQSTPELPERAALQSPDWQQRRAAFDQLLDLDPSSAGNAGGEQRESSPQAPLPVDQLDATRRMMLISLLEAENSLHFEVEARVVEEALTEIPPEDLLPEEYGYYHWELISAVVALGDAAALPALVGAMVWASNARDAVHDFGLAALGSLEKASRHRAASQSATALRALSTLLDNPDTASDVEVVARITAVATEAATHSGPTVRAEAAALLGKLADEDSLALLVELATSDPYRAEFLVGHPYMVREAASKALILRGQEAGVDGD